ncbi:MAG: CDP-alcohol phosphatidyltransferase family protein [Plesiomonas sp.]|uniref:CDP-alcohol phosphatidyltransferase family protein n=1 Tax=Plesiomonas sp. TaxID=2486279 RepID=UPI003F3F1799
MLDRFVLTHTRPAQIWLAYRAIQLGFTADRLTLCGFAIGISVIPLLAFQLPLWALIAILINRLFDGLDGTVARLNQPTDRGGFLDIVLDFLFYSAVPLGFALYSPVENALAAATLIYAFIGTGCSFLAFATIAEKQGLASTIYPKKSFYYLGGLTEASETILMFTLMCLFPQHFNLLAYLFSALCLITTLTRIYAGWKMFSSQSTLSK